MCLLFVSFAQYQFNFIKTNPLDGSYEKFEKPSFKYFTWQRWFNEDFQNTFNTKFENNIGFRNPLIRLKNQIDYSLFKVSNNYKVIIGANNCLFEEGYILDYCGQNFVGKTYIDEKLRRAKWVQDYLKTKGIDLIFVFEPGKASYHSEFIPERYHPEKKLLSNYKFYTQRCKELGIANLDLNKWFLSLKDTTKYPLYPRYGVHWSTYGMMLAADTLIKYIEKVHSIQIPHIYWNEMTITNKLKDADFDIEKTLNLAFELPHETMAYPKLLFEQNKAKTKPNVLTIADSYYWSIFNNNIPQNIFSKQQFWYYNKTIYPDIWGENAKYVDKLDFKKEVESQDVILIMLTEMNLYNAFYQFTDDAYKLYCTDYKLDSVYESKCKLLNNSSTYVDIIIEADKTQKKFEDVLNKKALQTK